MATAWQTLEEAALTLGISSRTLHRRIARGEVETRLEAGRREVLVTLPDPAPIEEVTRPVFKMPEFLNSTEPMSDVTDAGGQTMLALHEDRIRRTDLAIMAYQQSIAVAAREARQSRISSRWAWSTAVVALIALCLGATWATHRLTRADAQVETLTVQVTSLASEAQTSALEADKFRQLAESARIAAARAEGELSATKSQLAITSAAPTTQPTAQIQLIDPMKLVSAN